MHPLHYVALILGLALPPTTLALCPYAQQMARDASNAEGPRMHQARNVISAPEDKKGVLLMNRIAPGTSQLHISNADGTKERPLLSDPIYEYYATFSPDGQWISFTGEGNGDGNSDIYRVRTDGSDLQALVATPSMEDSVVISPNGKQAAYVFTANGYKANIWVLDLESGEKWNVTNTPFSPAANASLPDGYFRPAWSPDGEWLAFSSDRNSGWYGHGEPTFLGVSGWEHSQELSIYAIRPNGSDLRQLAGKKEWSMGSPRWSGDGKRVLFYEMTRENTWNSHRPESINSANSSLVSLDFETGQDRRVEVKGAGVKVFPQYVDEQGTIGYFYKGGEKEGMYTTVGRYINTTDATVRSPSWSPDGKSIVYEKTTWTVRPMGKKLYSWDPDWEYRFTDVFPQISNQKVLAITEKQLGNSSVVTMNANGSHERLAFNDMNTSFVDPSTVSQGLAGAFNPSWSPDGQWITAGVGFWFQSRAESGGRLVRAAANGSTYEVLTSSNATLPTDKSSTVVNSGFPSFSSHDGNQIVYRVWGADSTNGNKAQLGLRILDLPTRKTKTPSTERDNLPFFSPDGSRIVFTRNVSAYNYDACTIRPDGSDLQVLTSSGANDAHAVWTQDGRIMYSTGMFGFQYECALYDQIFQPYGQIMVMDADGRNKRVLTDSIWEDSMPVYIPKSYIS